MNIRLLLRFFTTVFACGYLLTTIATVQAITINHSDDFEDGTVMSWKGTPIGLGVPPVNESTGGPAGADDNYLHISADGSGPGGRLVTYSAAPWTGDFITAGVTTITADVNNLGSTSLELRLAFDGPGGKFGSTNSVLLAVGSGWQNVTFGITAADMTYIVGGSNSYLATFGGVTEMRLVHSTVPAYEGHNGVPFIVAELGVDNITATATPEPEAGLLLVISLVVAGLCSSRKWRRLRWCMPH